MEGLRTIPSKETVYAGVTFRSKLEAIWAAHFHGQGRVYVYEPEQFCLDMGRVFYTPDFFIESENLYIEIKPVFDGTCNEKEGLFLNYYEDALQKCFDLEKVVRPCAVDIYIGKPGTPWKFRFEGGEASILRA